MFVNLSFITTPTSDTRGTCLVLQVVDKRYIFGNLHEGLQRAFVQRGTRANKVSDVFLTGTTEWKNVGGLLGWLLSMADANRMASDAIKDLQREAQTQIAKHGGDKATSRAKLMATQDLSVQPLSIHGGPNIAQMIATARRFIFRKGHPLDVHEADFEEENNPPSTKPTWQNEQIRVWTVMIKPDTAPPSPVIQDRSDSKKTLKFVVDNMFDSRWRMDDLVEMSLKDVQLPAVIMVRDPQNKDGRVHYAQHVPVNPDARPDVPVFVRKPWPGALITSLPPSHPSETAICYIIQLPRQRGKFNPKAALALKVKPGPDFGKLTNGEPVIAADGTTVQPEQVLEPGRAGNGFIVAEIPSVHYVESFITKREFTDASIMEGIIAVMWILGPGVADDTRLQSFINRHSEWTHFISSPNYNANYIAYDSAAESLIRHHMIDPQRFDVPKFDNSVRPLPAALSNCHLANRDMQIKLEPKFQVDTEFSAPYLSTLNAVDEFPKDVLEMAEVAQKELALKEPAHQPLPGGENEIITLGTGSALPSKYRNVSSTLLRVPGQGSYLLDCGENTLGQLGRMYSYTELQEVLRDLKMIWISHMHADHHLGIASVIKAWYEAVHGPLSNGASVGSPEDTDVVSVLSKPGKLFVASETAMVQWLKEYSSVENYGFQQLIPIEAFTRSRGERTVLRYNGQEIGFNNVPSEISNAMRLATGLSDLAVCAVPHCHGARGVALSFPDGFKLSYSGDSRPSQNLVEIGKNSTVLLHEATFDDEMQADAKAKKHSTTFEALGVGVAMNAKRVVLTHFSQRYSKIPVMSDLGGRKVVLEETDASNLDPAAVADGGDPLPTLVDPTPGPTPVKTSEQADAAKAKVEVTTGRGSRNGSPSGRKSPLRGSQSPVLQFNRDVSNSTQAREMKVAVAFDHMRIKVKDIENIEKFTPAFLALYKDANDHLNVTDAERALRQARAKERKVLQKEQNKKARVQY